MEIIYKQNKLYFNYLFNDHIERVYLIFSTPELYAVAYSKYLSNMVCLKGKNNLASIDSEFEYTWKNSVKVKFRVVESINNENEKLINSYCYSVESTNYRYHLIYKLSYNTVEENTLLRYQLIFETSEALNFYFQNFDYTEKIILFSNVEAYLKKQAFLLEQEESILINCDIDTVWKVVGSLKLFREYVPIFADSVEYDGCKISNSLTIKCGQNLYNFIIRRRIRKENYGEFILEMYGSKPSSPLHFIIFKVFNVEGKCLVLFGHNFIQAVSYEEFKSLSRKKKKILKMLKSSLIFSCNK
jgi:hypothetical protein